MRITVFVRTFLLSAALVFLSACATTVSTTNQLAPGMKAAQVKEVMGEPSQTQFVSNKLVWKYSLHRGWSGGFMPYYLVFNKDTQTLEQWYADQAEFQAQQELWSKAAANWPTVSPPAPTPAPVQPVQVRIQSPRPTMMESPKSTRTNCHTKKNGDLSCVSQEN